MANVITGNEVASIKIPHTQVYMATHDGGDNRLPYRYRSFISFSFGGKWIEEYIRQTSSNYLQRKNTDELMGLNKTAYGKGAFAQSQVESLLKVYNDLMNNPTKFGLDKNGLDNTTKAIKEELDKLHDIYVVTEEDEKQWQIWLGNATEGLEEITEASEQAAQSLSESISEHFQQAIGSTDLGSIMQDVSKGMSLEDALIKTFVNDLIDYIANFEKMQFLLNIVKEFIEAISPALDMLLNIVWLLVMPLNALFKAINSGLSWMFGDFNEMCDELYDSMNREKDARDKNTKDMTDAYQRLIASMREQEEYYLKKKAELNSWSLKDYVSGVTPVNDMILTPNGNFSTNPNDTIIATKNPSGLGGGDVKVTVNNYSDSNVDVQQRKNADGLKELLVTISRKIASDVAGGYNGWDGAFAMQQQRIGGRRI